MHHDAIYRGYCIDLEVRSTESEGRVEWHCDIYLRTAPEANAKRLNHRPPSQSPAAALELGLQEAKSEIDTLLR